LEIFLRQKPYPKFLNLLDSSDQLTKTILYNLNPADNEVMASMIGNFNDGKIKGKVQFGSGWWFLDQKDGIIKQLNALSNMGLISTFIGMLTDSRRKYPIHVMNILEEFYVTFLVRKLKKVNYQMIWNG